MENTKREFSLDFNKPRSNPPAPSLVTPILNLSTPEISKMITGDELAVLTPNGISPFLPQGNVLPSPLIPTTVNNNNNIMNGANGNNNPSNNQHQNGNNNHKNHNSSIKRTNDCNGRSKSNKQDPDIDKIEKKRERNRLAAKKCRQRKLETIEELQKTVKEWESRYQRLETEFERFKNIKMKEIEQLSVQNSQLKSLVGS